ncbi:Tex family protein [Paludibacter sp.]|uniref:Tex family protein n=1 Tax=Paludibacter sp. TaxID=1898105 RepID=UPI0013531729|nr:Tex family protein [Paludibacter sp.]MTK52903.1 RNA-binding transcriptional accessory protein [Paludibacter sp.]
MLSFSVIVSGELQLREQQVKNTIDLLEEGATIPFISRYRKERTGSLDEVQIAAIKERYEKLCELEKRKQTVLNSIEEQGKLTDDLRDRIDKCLSMTELEDIYLPYKPKRRTKAEIAREKGLEPLAKILMRQVDNDVESKALSFVKGDVKDADDALKGARDIIAEWVNENEVARNSIRTIFSREAIISSRVIKGKEVDGDKYRDYFELEEPLRRCSSHRLLAMRRGESEGILRVAIQPEEERCLERLDKLFVKARNAASDQVSMAIGDSYKRLLKPSIETEFAAASKEKADAEAIRVFAENLKQLLLAAPLGQKRVMGVDPGFRTGCKIVCLNEQGVLLHHDVIYPHPPQSDVSKASDKIIRLIAQFQIQAVAIGNGTASRETEQFFQNYIPQHDLQVFVVSENGASVYSASKIAREEFPDEDVTVRGAVSIGRRLMDPLSELVKIDPKSIGVGQYQHDVNQTELKTALDQTVENCVNKVGVQVNTASKYLLTYISGLGPQLAQNIVDYRTANGAFKSRKELMKVPKMGAKTFEQAAGFLRVENVGNPLDNSAVHPESYPVVEQMAKDLQCTVADLIGSEELRKKVDVKKYVTEKIGLPTLVDIMEELAKPGRDPRQQLEAFAFDPTIKDIQDLKIGQVLPGVVTNITNFGAFVDIGIHENGLVHVSQIADRFVSNPAEVLSLHQHVTVRVLDVDLVRKRVSLSMKQA